MARSHPRRRARSQWLRLPRNTCKKKTNSYVERFSEARIHNRLQRVVPHIPRVTGIQGIHRQKNRTLVSLGSDSFARRSTSPILIPAGYDGRLAGAGYRSSTRRSGVERYWNPLDRSARSFGATHSRIAAPQPCYC